MDMFRPRSDSGCQCPVLGYAHQFEHSFRLVPEQKSEHRERGRARALFPGTGTSILVPGHGAKEQLPGLNG